MCTTWITAAREVDRAKAIVNAGLTFNIVIDSDLVPPRAILSAFFSCGYDDAPDKRVIKWQPFELDEVEYSEFLSGWTVSYPEARPEELGVDAPDFGRWFTRAMDRRGRLDMTKKQIAGRFGRPDKTWSHGPHDVWAFFHESTRTGNNVQVFVFRDDRVIDYYWMVIGAERESSVAVAAQTTWIVPETARGGPGQRQRRLGCSIAMTPMLMCDNIGASIDFYVNALEFEVVERDDDPGNSGWASLRCGYIHLTLACRTDAPTPVMAFPQAVFNYSQEVVATLRKSLISMGHQVGELRDTVYGMTEFALTDPDGHVLWFAQETNRAPGGELGSAVI